MGYYKPLCLTQTFLGVCAPSQVWLVQSAGKRLRELFCPTNLSESKDPGLRKLLWLGGIQCCSKQLLPLLSATSTSRVCVWLLVLILLNIALILPETHSSSRGQLLPGSFSKASSGHGVKTPPGECRSTINDVQLLSQGRSARRFF